MAKTKSKEELKEALNAAKEELSVAKTERKNFEKENGLKKGEDHSGNKKWAKLNSVVEKKEAAVESLKEELAAMKSAGGGRATKYEYPADCVTAADKKKYRTKMRAEAAKAEKGEKPEKKEKKEKKDKKEKPEKSKKNRAEEEESEED